MRSGFYKFRIPDFFTWRNQKETEEKRMRDKKTKGNFRFPHEFIIILCLLVLACILTYVVPAGNYTRVKTASGMAVVKAGSFAFVKSTPESLLKIPVDIMEGFYNAKELIFAILIFTGAMQIVMQTGAMQNLTSVIIQKFGKKQSIAIAIIMAVVAVLSSPMGYNPFIAFVPLGLYLATQMGYDAIVGVAIFCLAAAMGPNAGMLNPSTTGVGNQLAGLPTFYGFGYRCIGFVVITGVTIVYIIHYANKVKADPTKSLVYGIPQDIHYADNGEEKIISFRQKLVLLVMLIGVILLIIGCTKWEWDFQKMSAFFLVFGPVCGLIYGTKPNDICNYFVDGCKMVVRAIILIGMAYSISVVLTHGNILDTVVYGVSHLLNYIPKCLQAPGMLVIHTIINFFITSGNGQAVVTMPVMLPVANIIGMSPETAILALNYGDGFTNIIFPHSAALMSFLALSKVPYHKWLKFVIKLVLLWYMIGFILLIIAQAIGY